MKSLYYPAVIVQAEAQKDRVQKLVDYCYKLDGTSITILEGDTRTRATYPHCNNAAFHQAAEHFKGRPFIWLEPDSIPLKPNWRRELCDEYKRSGKEFMLSSDSHPPLDIIGGIGVYGSNSHYLIPKNISKGGWDGWMLEHLKSVIHFSPLIQHTYGRYDGSRAWPWRFPKNKSIIREDAVLFHRDRFQELITPALDKRFHHTGDLGDIVAALPTIRQLGGGELVISDSKLPTGKSPRGSMRERYELIKSLLEQQPYISKVEWQDKPSDITHDFSGFRTTPRVVNLAYWQAVYLGVYDLDISPWIFVESTPHLRVIVSRSLRYHNPDFPWSVITHKYKDKLLFVGLPEEHKAFEEYTKSQIDYAPTDNLLDVAKLIAGATIGFYNQSCPFWIAAGLGKKLVQESWRQQPDSVLVRPNAYYTYDDETMWQVNAGLALL